MPELAEVAFYCSRWNPGWGERILQVRMNGQKRCFRSVVPSRLSERLLENRVIRSLTHGKRMLFELDRRLWLGIHLGMTGSLLIRPPEADLEKHDHLALETRVGWLVFNDPRQFGRIESFESDTLPEFWHELPFEPISEKFDFHYFRKFVDRGSKQPLKSMLMDQSRFPGIGNWMADEVLWQSRIRPQRPIAVLGEKEVKELFRAVKRVSRVAMARIASDFSDPPKTWLFHRRWKAGDNCPKTGVPLNRENIGGRTTCWSEAWQR